MNLDIEKKIFEKENMNFIAGIDEVGRGSLIGPVVASAVIFPKEIFQCKFPIEGINDSKKISEQKRKKVYSQIVEYAVSIGVGIVGEKTIDRINIFKATQLAMEKSIECLKIKPNFLLIDGKHFKNFKISFQTIVKGDEKSISIAAASIIAKVTRDEMMKKFQDEFPNFSFIQHKGYATKKHFEEIEKFGQTKIHRKTFFLKGWKKTKQTQENFLNKLQ